MADTSIEEPNISKQSKESMSVDTDDSKQKSDSIDNSKSNKKEKSPKKSKKGNNKKSRKRKLEPTTDTTQKDSQPPAKKKKKSRGWSESEEKLFIEGLETYGREWKKIALHVGNNRNAASIRSHAQVHFLKLLKNKQPLPPKVLESGNGFTLGGDPLNKYSSTAIRYFGGADKVPMIDGVISDQEAAEKLKRPKKSSKDAKDATTKTTKTSAKKSKKKKKKRNKYYDDSTDDEDYECFNNLSVSNAKPSSSPARRSSRNRNKAERHQCVPSHIANPYGLRTDIVIYDGFENAKQKLSDLRIMQPYEVKYCPNALLVADIHAHLLRSVEIMGLMGGSYNAETKIVQITKCYPLKEEEQNDETVIAQSLDTLCVRDQIKADGLMLVGWYHSHPNFENVPSNLDCYQHETNKPESSDMPYIGLIIESLWNTKIEGSHYRFFNTMPLNGAKDLEYMALQFMTQKEIKYNLDDEGLLKQISDLVERYTLGRYDMHRTDFGEIGDALFENVKGHLDVMKESEDSDKVVEQFMTKIRGMFMKKRDIWWMTNKPQISKNEDKENANSLN